MKIALAALADGTCRIAVAEDFLGRGACGEQGAGVFEPAASVRVGGLALGGVLRGEVLIEDVIGVGDRVLLGVEDDQSGAGFFDECQPAVGIAHNQTEAVGIERQGANMGDGLGDIGAGGQDRVQRGQRKKALVAQRTGDAGHADAQAALVAAGRGPDSAGEVEVVMGIAAIRGGGFEEIHPQLFFADVVGFSEQRAVLVVAGADDGALGKVVAEAVVEGQSVVGIGIQGEPFG